MNPTGPAVDLTGLTLKGPGGLSQQLVEALRQRILSGEFPAGARLPTTRALAQALHLSRNTVVRSYERLLDEGLIGSRVGDGSYVTPPLARRSLASISTAPRLPSAPAWSALQGYGNISSRMGSMRAFRWGCPAVDLFPRDTWRQIQAHCWRHLGPSELDYGDPAGHPRLRELLAEHLRSTRALSCSAEQVLITAGAQQAISLLGMALLGPDQEAAVESPGYRAATAALGLHARRVRRVPLDEQGLRLGALQALGPQCRLLYLTPSHQFPSGLTMSLQRRLDLLAWARQQDAWIIEDDYDSEYRYHGLPLPPLASLDRDGRTLYVGSLSKLMFPGLRMGYLVAPAAWIPELARLRAVMDRHSPSLDQLAMTRFIEQGHFLRHLRRMRRAASERREVLLTHWQRWIEPLGLPLPAPEAGLHALLPLPEPALEARLQQAAEAHGLDVGALHQVGGLPDHFSSSGLVLGFAAVPPAELQTATRRLAAAWAPCL